MKRWIIRSFFIGVLLVCVGGWVRSYWFMDEIGLGAWKNRAMLHLTMNTAYTQRGSLLIMVERLHFVDEARSPNVVRNYFEHNFWGFKRSINGDVPGVGYMAPKSAAEDFGIKATVGFGVKHVPTFSMWKGTAEKSESVFLIPLWFPTIISTALLLLVWRKTRPKVKARAFPVELAKPSEKP